jgi:hypothetical protein
MTPTDTAAPPGANLTSTQSTGSGGALVRSGGSEISAGVFSGIAAFEAAQRMAQCLCSSTMVPPEYRGQQGLANSLIALEIAGRMGLSPLVVMQNMTPIHGRPSWSSSFLIATVNASGRFTPLRFQFDDEENPSWCFAEASDRSSGETLKGEKISIAMAKREGWWSRKDRHGNETSKWQTMTGQMLRYRAASFWVRVYCPEMSLGLTTQEEALDGNAPTAAVETVTVREVPATNNATPAGAVPQPIRPMPVVASAPTIATAPTHAEPAITTAEEASPTKPAPLVADESDGEPAPKPDDQPTTRARRGAARIRRSAAAPDEAGSSTPAAAALPPEPVGADPAEPDPVPTQQLTPELGANQELFPVDASTADSARSEEAFVAPAVAVADSGAQTPEPQEPAEPTSAEVVRSGLQEIPRIASLQALDGAKARVNALLASGRINEDGAERLWAVIDRRRSELQAAIAAEETP